AHGCATLDALAADLETRRLSPSRSPRFLRPPTAAALTAALLIAPSAGRSAASEASTADTPVVARAVEIGLENVSADSLGGTLRIAFENRRYRHPADVVGRLQGATSGPFIAVERRLGLAAAAMTVEGRGDSTTFRVRTLRTL